MGCSSDIGECGGDQLVRVCTHLTVLAKLLLQGSKEVLAVNLLNFRNVVMMEIDGMDWCEC